MNLLRRSGAPSAFTWLLGLALGTTCAAMMACSATPGSQTGSGGWASQSGGGPLGGGGGGSNDESPGNGGDATAPTSPQSGGDDGSTSSPEASVGASDAGAGDAVAMDGATDSANVGPDFTLVDTAITGIIDGSPVTGFDPIAEGATINLAQVGSALSVRANTVPAAVGSVAFALDATYTHTENTPPYFLCSDDGAGNITSCASILTVGKHTLTATPYSAAGLTGDAGAPILLDFTIVDVADAGGQ